jgi:hypothetical protein
MKETSMKKLHQRHFHIRHNFMNWVTAMIILLTILILNTVYIATRLSADKTVPTVKLTSDSTKILTSLQSDETSAYTVKVKNVTENATNDPAFTIDPDHTMLIMDISITNHTPGKEDLVPVNQLYVRDHQGDTFMMHPSMFLKTPLAATTLDPGATVQGQISFDVPKNLPNPLVYVDFGWNHDAPTVIDVLK